MADSTPVSTNPAAPGMSTSEGKFTIAAQVVGFLLATFGTVLTQYAATHPGNVWAGVAVTTLGVLLALATQYGYVKGRAIVKNAMLQSTIDWAAPEVVALLEKLVAKQLASPSSSAATVVLPVPAAASAAAAHSVTVAAPFTTPSPL